MIAIKYGGAIASLPVSGVRERCYIRRTYRIWRKDSDRFIARREAVMAALWDVANSDPRVTFRTCW